MNGPQRVALPDFVGYVKKTQLENNISLLEMIKGTPFRELFQFVNLALLYRTDQDNLYTTRIGALLGETAADVYNMTIFADKKYKKFYDLEKASTRDYPKPVFSKGGDKQYHMMSIKYVPKFDAEYSLPSGSKIYSLPTFHDIRQVIVLEGKLLSSSNPDINPKYSPIIPIFLGPNYFCVFAIIRYPNPLRDMEGNPITVERVRDRILHFDRVFATEVIDIIRRNGTERFLTKAEIDEIKDIYKRSGVYLGIFEYKDKIRYTPL